jgi:hypothetical protein
MASHGPHPKTDAERFSRFMASRERAAEKQKAKLDSLRGDPDFWARQAFAGARHRAAGQGLPFDIEVADVRALHRPDCTCCSTTLVFQAKRGKQGPLKNSAAVDRIRPELGYVRGNLGLLCNACNGAKRNIAEPSRLRSLAAYIEAQCPDPTAPRSGPHASY